ALHANRGPTLIHNGSTDDVVEIENHGPDFFRDLRARTVAAAGGEKNVFTYGFTADGGHRPYFITRPVATWLNEQLRFPGWAAISADETLIGDWARTNEIGRAHV